MPIVETLEKGLRVAEQFGYPVMVRPHYILLTSGGAVAKSQAEARKKLQWALDMSPVNKVVIERIEPVD